MYLLIIIILLTGSIETFSQEDLTYENVDKKTSELYLNKKWDELISYGDRALRNRVDFYSLRVRLGIAYYKKEKYFYAIPNFENALELGFIDALILQYLYYSYLFTGRIEDSEVIFSKLPSKVQKRIKPLNNSFIDNSYIEMGQSISNDYSKNGNVDLDETDNLYGEQVLNGNYFHLNAGLKQLPFSRVGISYCYTYLNLSKRKEIEYNNIKNINNYSQIQNRFYNKFDFLIANGLIISPSVHYINIKDNTIYAKYDSVTYRYNMSTMSYDSLRFYHTLSNKETNLDNFVLSLAVLKYLSIFKFGISGSFSYLNDKHQTQYGASFTIFPFGKISFFTNTNAALHYQDKVANLIVTQLIGGRILKNLYLEGFAVYGKMNNYNEQNGYLVFNDPGAIKFKFGAELNYYFLNNLSAYLVYMNQQRERNYLTYVFKGLVNNLIQFQQEIKKVNYQVNTFLAGIKFNF